MLKLLKKRKKHKSIYAQVADHKEELVRRVLIDSKNKVMGGPFKDTILTRFKAWSQSDYVSIILGQYELELHDSIEKFISLKPDCVINIGCSDGYYAVGFKKRLPEADVFGFDIDKTSETSFAQNCQNNFVKICYQAKFDWGNTSSLDKYEKIVFFIDIEGGEIDVCKLPRSVLNRSYFIIETHDLFVPDITNKLNNFLKPTHEITIISEAGRNPNQFAELDKFSNFDRYLILIELRGAPQKWIVANPKI